MARSGIQLPRPARALLVAGLAVLCLAQLVAPAAASRFLDDPNVQQAQAGLDGAREHAAQLQAELDAAAADYEQAQAQHVRLLEEFGDAQARIGVAQERADAEAAIFARRVVAAYKRPDVVTSLAAAVLDAPDAATAMHRAELADRVTARTAERAIAADEVVRARQGTVRQEQILVAGMQASAAERAARAAALDVAVDGAHAQVAQARRGVVAAEQAAQRRAEEHARLERERAAAAAAAAAAQLAAAQARDVASAAPPPAPVVGGKACPIGAPNGFIDSWGFPRSGGRTHQGVDMFAAYGMPLYAVTSGTVTVSNNRLGGLVVWLTDDGGDRYYYAHLASVTVASGQRVTAGMVIGGNGDSGNARGTPPHLHWEYHPGGAGAVNPYPLARALCR